MVCSGIADVSRGAGTPPMPLGGIDLIDLRSGLPIHQVPLGLTTPGGVTMTRNPSWFYSDAGGLRAYFLPEVDDEVLVAFEHGSLEHPYIMGSLWNGKDKPHENNSDGKNDNRTIKSRSGHVVRLCDSSGGEKIEVIDKTGSNKIVITSSNDKITIEARGDIEITSQTGKVKITAIGVEITSTTDVKIQAQTSIDASATGQVNISGAVVNIN